MKKRVLFLGIILVMVVSGAVFAAGDVDKKTVTMFSRSEVVNWDPALWSSGTDLNSLGNSYEYLVRFNWAGGKTEVLPWLATSWEKAADNMSWTFKLRKGVKFHDGEPFNARAVKVSIERTMKLGKGTGWIWAAVKEVQIIDDYTVKFVLKWPSPINLIAGSPLGATIYSPKAAEKGTEWFKQGNVAGTGPYIIEKLELNQQKVLTRFDDYWDGWDGKHFDRIIIKIVSENSTKVQMMMDGEVDIFRGLPVDLLPRLEKAEGVEVLSESGYKSHMLLLNTKKFPTDNLKIRQAICYAFDYEAAVNSINKGYAKLASGPVPAALMAHSPDLKKYSFNLEKAKQLVKESGIPKDKLKLRMDYYGEPGLDQYNQMLQAALSQIGIKAEVNTAAFTALRGLAEKLETAPNLFSTSWWAYYPTPSDFLWTLWRTEKKTTWNYSYYSNPAYDKLIDQASGEEGVDQDQAVKTYQKAEKILMEDAVAIFAGELKNVIVKQTSLKGFKFHPSYYHDWFYDMYRE